ncbi:hypothetical protein WA026_014549 [Henosepilachna vigintioctopunctata]|uniref:Uncharacterized protein n=1 Tax=Henosepilachna vigintioctopunctata TaxID=420089 RepID=A0AAW1UC59_9CUCU
MTSPHIITRTKALDENIRLLNSIPTDLSKEILKRVQLMEEFQDDYDDLAKQYGLEKIKYLLLLKHCIIYTNSYQKLY